MASFCKQSIFLHCFLCFHKVIRKDPYPFTGIPNLKELPRLDLPLSVHHPLSLSSSRLCVLPKFSGLTTAEPQLGLRQRGCPVSAVKECSCLPTPDPVLKQVKGIWIFTLYRISYGRIWE